MLRQLLKKVDFNDLKTPQNSILSLSPSLSSTTFLLDRSLLDVFPNITRAKNEVRSVRLQFRSLS